VCGYAQTLPELIRSAILQGLGAGVVRRRSPSSATSSARDRGLYQGSAAQSSVVDASSARSSGLLRRNLTWRWIVYVNLPSGAVSICESVAVFTTRTGRRACDRLSRRRALAGTLTCIVLLTSIGARPSSELAGVMTVLMCSRSFSSCSPRRGADVRRSDPAALALPQSDLHRWRRSVHHRRSRSRLSDVLRSYCRSSRAAARRRRACS